jgi:DNA segregation ATPase FtsK/SpoIIIE, S-DNA-T family
VQGAFVQRNDIERVVEFLRNQGEPQFDIIPEVPEDEDDSGSEMEASDELFAAAVQYVVQEQEASVSMIQRRFKVGYARAGRLIDLMEQRGVVGPHEGSRPRQVFVTPGNVQSVLPNRDAIREYEDEQQRADWVNEDAREEDEYVMDDEDE